MKVGYTRVFVKHLNSGCQNAEGPDGTEERLGVDAWTVEENITIIGWQLNLLSHHLVGNDGMGNAEYELSQSGLRHKDGQLCNICTSSHWNTTPAFGDNGEATIAQMLPKQCGIPVSEGGTIYMHCYLGVSDLTAGLIHSNCLANIFYVKG